MILLDTVTLSETVKRSPEPLVLTWLAKQDPSKLYVSVVSLGEIERGITKVREKNRPYASQLQVWQKSILREYADHILPFDLQTALEWGRLVATLRRSDVDMLIAATARQHGFTIATRNVKHFESTAIEIINPWLTIVSP